MYLAGVPTLSQSETVGPLTTGGGAVLRPRIHSYQLSAGRALSQSAQPIPSHGLAPSVGFRTAITDTFDDV